MELLSKPTVRDHVHYGIAYLFTIIDGALALLAANQIRATILLIGTLGEWRRRGFRVADRAGWIVLGIAWLAYVMAVEHAHRTGVTQARVRRARGQRMPAAVAHRPLLRWLWQHDLDIAVQRFLRTVLMPLGLLLAVRLLNAFLEYLTLH